MLACLLLAILPYYQVGEFGMPYISRASMPRGREMETEAFCRIANERSQEY
jgi:hypothetical protein